MRVLLVAAIAFGSGLLYGQTFVAGQSAGESVLVVAARIKVATFYAVQQKSPRQAGQEPDEGLSKGKAFALISSLPHTSPLPSTPPLPFQLRGQ